MTEKLHLSCLLLILILAMDDASSLSNPRTVQEVFKDFLGRRSAVLKALTSDVEDFCQQCDPDKENLCLYGYPDEVWEVNLPAEEVPPELPEPALGINFARDGMLRKDWLSLVAVHSDAWLIAVAFYFGARFDKSERTRLFNLINDVPTVLEIVTGRKPLKEKYRANNNANTSNHSAVKAKSNKPRPSYKEDYDEEEAEDYEDNEEDIPEDDEDDYEDTLCGICGESYGAGEFWICCDVCEGWFHGKCVKITPARAEHIKQYKCPSCNNKRARV